jgi:hypothetical protein
MCGDITLLSILCFLSIRLVPPFGFVLPTAIFFFFFFGLSYYFITTVDCSLLLLIYDLYAATITKTYLLNDIYAYFNFDSIDTPLYRIYSAISTMI